MVVFNLSDWRSGDVDAIDEASRAADAWRVIQRSPDSITIDRGTDTTLSAQTVAIEYGNTSTESRSDGAGQTSQSDVIVFGIRNHATLTDTDIEQGDQFEWNGHFFRVVEVRLLPGEIQATAVAYG